MAADDEAPDRRAHQEKEADPSAQLTECRALRHSHAGGEGSGIDRGIQKGAQSRRPPAGRAAQSGKRRLGWSQPFSLAWVTALQRLLTPSRSRMLWPWFLTVCTDRHRRL